MINESNWTLIWKNPLELLKRPFSKKDSFYLSSIFVMQYFFSLLGLFEINNFPFWGIFLIFLISPFLGIPFFYLFAACFYFIGKVFFNGRASLVQIRNSFAWSQAPFLITVGMWLIFLTFIEDPFSLIRESWENAFFIYFITIFAFLSSSLLFSKMFKVAEELSNLKSLIIISITYLLIFIFFGLIYTIFYYFDLFLKLFY